MSELRLIRSALALAASALALVSVLVQCDAERQESGRGGSATAQALGWSALGAPAQPRAGHTATLLGDGRVLVAGGALDDSTEILDPRTSPIGVVAFPMGVPRVGHTATMLLSGQVLFAGGDGGKIAELFSPATSAFTLTGDLAVARVGNAAVRMASGRVLVAGGAGPDDTTTEIYDPSTGVFSGGPARNVAGDGELVLLGNGKILFVGASAADVFDVDKNAWSQVAPGLTPSAGKRAALRLASGNVLVSSTDGVAGDTKLQIFDPAANAGAGGFLPSGPIVPNASAGMSPVLLPDGKVLLTGTSVPPATTNALVYDPATDTTANDDPAPTAHHDQTATLLANGDVLVIGGEESGADIRPWPGGVLPDEQSVAMIAPRFEAVAARLHDGTVLVAGGRSHPTTASLVYDTAELFDPVAKSAASTGSMSGRRTRFAGVTLTSGKVLVSGGANPDVPDGSTGRLATAEVYDPATKQWHAVGPMARGRRGHSLTRLGDGRVLVTGGCETSPCVAELFDPAGETFTTISAPLADREDHGAVALPNGLVLLVGGASSELFDPATTAFRETASSPTSARSGRTARLLPTGHVFAAGASSPSNELYDPVLDGWTAIPAMPFAPQGMSWALTPTGDLLMTGGVRSAGDVAESRMLRLDPLVARTTPPAVVFDGGGSGRRDPASLPTTNARVLVAGGDPSGTALLYGDGASAASRPIIDATPSKSMVGGKALTVTGQRFVSRSGDTPLAFWVPDTGDAIIPTRVLGFSATTLSVVAPASAFHGPGFLHVVTGGIASPSIAIELTAAQPGAACSFDAECVTGSCADGVCCDERCDSPCEACSRRRKGFGADGVCESIQPGTDPSRRCVASQGGDCTSDESCAATGKTLTCVRGVCCDAPCVGACLSCALPGKAGKCSALPGCELACDGDHTLKKAGSADVDCSPYKCDGAACKKTCASVNDCTGATVCTLDGVCDSPPALLVTRDSFIGCAIARGRPRAGSLVAILFGLGMLAGAARRRGVPRS